MKHWYRLRLLALLLALSPCAQAQTLDASFAPTVLKNPPASFTFYVRAMLPQPDGKVVVAGGYDFVNGTLTSRVRRLNPDGSPDPTFQSQQGTGPDYPLVQALALQADGKILVGGSNAVYYSGTYAPGLTRINADGSVDASFNAGNAGFDPYIFGNPSIRCLAVQPDGKILVGGSMVNYNGQAIGGLVRLNTDGTLDPSFSAGTGIQVAAGVGVVETILVQADGHIVIGGTFSSYNGTAVNNMVRLTASGALDTSFGIGTGPGGLTSAVRSVVQQPDGKLLVGGTFTTFNGQPTGNVLRLNLDGTQDNTFQAGTPALSGGVYRIRLRPDGSLLLVGAFTSYNGTPRGGMAKVSSTGALDAGFATGSGLNAGGSVYDLVENSNGTFLTGGTFTSYNGTARTGLALLSSGGALDAAYNPVLEVRGTVSTTTLLNNGQMVIVGAFSNFNGATVNNSGLHLINADGSYNSLIVPTPSTSTSYVQPNGTIYAGRLSGTSGNYTFTISRLLLSGANDASFTPVALSLVGNTYQLNPPVVQANGNVLLTGNFSSANGNARAGVLQLLPNGTLTSFAPAAAPWQTAGVVPQFTALPNGQILAAWTDAAAVRTSLIRLNADGTTDNSFSIGAGATGGTFTVLGVTPTGGVLLSGGFTSFAGQATPTGLVRLTSTGSLDATFAPATALRAAYVQADGRLLGMRVPTPPTAQLVRLNLDGSLDPAFTPVSIPQSIYTGSVVNGVAVQPADNKIVVWGGFATVAGQPRIGLARLNNAVLATREARSALALHAYPNPARQRVQLQLPAPAAAGAQAATLLDLQGRVVRGWALTTPQTTLELPLSGVAPGVYLLRVQTQRGPAQQRLLIER
ncbi:T9SS type A sorting domain-containing protein [Hymenobacter sp. 15J16-1T3B]|uniref:T9SS type A sorting domain-containing protein n=1 Tax=Hymenobacter sp. 15J16-1T3B TaxID=2886941 RepID=UPI001D11EDC3|nr:T9SS type A sorting domain-containing protein [Hymenobacter sp. 15J16-1T3B]MCC3160777.1 T9SS type A sorting domain-containing protein [Hymenobacter sp. 15J16-1T3B]